MSASAPATSPRRDELLELAYGYVLEHGVADLSLRPLATAIKSSPRVLLFLFGSKAELVQAILARAREDELELLARVRGEGDLETVAAALWRWLAAADHRGLLTLWVEGYARSLIDRDGPWASFAAATVADWLAVLSESGAGEEDATLVLAVLRGTILDLLATGDLERTTEAVNRQLALMRGVR
ncbi:MAG: TetR/AcrR family transcriptional regulator [Solirubrobacterales bacterium]|nr:TetR/AcrR family transcriptional regulator [Solirubrobacterales bacterium]